MTKKNSGHMKKYVKEYIFNSHALGNIYLYDSIFQIF